MLGDASFRAQLSAMYARRVLVRRGLLGLGLRVALGGGGLGPDQRRPQKSGNQPALNDGDKGATDITASYEIL